MTGLLIKQDIAIPITGPVALRVIQIEVVRITLHQAHWLIHPAVLIELGRRVGDELAIPVESPEVDSES